MRILVPAGIASLIAAACSGTPASQTIYGSNGPPLHAAVASIELQPNAATIVLNKTTQLVAIPKDASGNPLSDRVVSWSSSNDTIASVTDSGVVKGKHAGHAGIKATSEGVTGSAALTVSDTSPTPVASVSVSLNSSSLVVGQGTQATTIEKDASGNALTGRTVTFSSSNTNVASVSSTGYVTAIAPGSAVITALSEGVSGTAALVVAPAPVASVAVTLNGSSVTVGQSSQAVVTLKDASGNTLTGRTITYTSGNTSVATVSSSGLVTAVTAGSAVITATSEGVSGSATLTVTSVPSPVASVTVTLNSSSITIGQSTQAVVTLKDASGNTLTGRTITYSSSNTGVATVSSTGLVTSVAVGTASITATSESISGSATVTVAPPPVASVTVTLNSSSLTAGQTTQAVVMLKDASGNVLTGRTITYTSGTTSVATVSSTGLVTAVAAGSAVITATSEGVSGSATLTVTPVPVASVTVTLNSSSLTVGQSTQAVATLKDASGNVLTGRTITYTSSSTSVATVSSAGLVTAIGAGSTTITATSGGVSGSATLTVTLAPVATVTVSLNNTSLTVGQSTQAVVTLKDASGNTLTGRTITYTSSNTSVATVSSSGLVTAVATGTAQITATSESQTGSATLTVQASTGAAVEPVYNSATDKLILTDGFDSYTGILTGSPSFVSRYPDYRAVNRSDAVVSLDSYVSLVSPGRGGSGHALRLAYGNPAVAGSSSTLDGASDIVVGPSGRLGSVGGWNGTLPQQAGPYVHFMFTTWIRFSPGADPSAGPGNGDSGVKGFMFFHDGGQRYEHPPHRLKDYNGGRYTQTRWDMGPPHPPNATTGLNHFKTATGEPPAFSQYADGNWHRFTVELYPRDNQVTPHLFAGHQGERVWIDGTLIFDNVDNLGFNGDVTTISGCPPWGGDYCYTAGITYWFVFGNYVNGATANASPAFYVDFDDWIAWTN